MKKVITIVIIVLALIILAAGGYYFLEVRPNNNQDDTSINESKYPTEGEFMAKILEEEADYLIVEPKEYEEEYGFANQIKVNLATPREDSRYGAGRNILIKYNSGFSEGELLEITTDDISPDGHTDYILTVKVSETPEKKKIANSQEIFAFDQNYDFYFYGIDEVTVEIDGETMPIIDALMSSRLSFNQMIKDGNEYCKNLISYDDGGSVEFQYNDYTIIKFHTLDGNRDFYICKPGTTINDVSK